MAMAAATVVLYVAEGNWSSAVANDKLLLAIYSVVFAIVIALIPYGALVILLRRARQSPVFQVAAFGLVIALPIVGFGYWRINSVATGGWDYFIVPFWQLVLLAVLRGIGAVLLPPAEQQPSGE
jgi:hypothetical protein